MHSYILKSSIAGLALLAWGSAQAQAVHSANIDFTGTISPVTCSISTDSRKQRIDFGIVPPNTTGFTGGGAAVGNVATDAYRKLVTIVLEGCSTPGQGNQPVSARVRVSGPVNADGRLSTGNTSVDIQMMEHNSTDVWDLKNFSRNVNLTAGSNMLRFYSRYYVALAPVQPGEASASATFNMDYQ